jgi:hypothetical protein
VTVRYVAHVRAHVVGLIIAGRRLAARWVALLVFSAAIVAVLLAAPPALVRQP